LTRVYLSPPELTSADRREVLRALDEGWIAPVGPEITAFESELAATTGRHRAVALSSGTAALHLALISAGVDQGDKVLVSSLTFAATANAIRYVGAEPVFVDSDPATWNMDPDLLAEALARSSRFKAVIPVDLYGQCADYRRIGELCARFELLMISDAAESLGASLGGSPAGSFGEAAVLSFNGNKIITTSGGGALVTDRDDWADRARFLATQARDPAPHYEHSQLGYNYRLSNVLAALGRSQLADLERRVLIRRSHRQAYHAALADLPGVQFMPEIDGGTSTFWLTALTIDHTLAGTRAADVIALLDQNGIEARPVWKPMHLQPLYRGCEIVGGGVSESLFRNGLCLPSGSSLLPEQRERIIELIRESIEASSGLRPAEPHPQRLTTD